MKNEKCFLVMVPYLRPDFPPMALAILKGIFDTYGIQCKTRDLNIDVSNFFTDKDIEKLEKFCSDGIWKDKNIVKKIRLFFRQSIKKYIIPYKPTVVGISLFSFFMQRTTELFCLELRKLLPKVEIFLGGSGVTNFFHKGETDDWPKKIIDYGIADHITIGEGENAVIEYIHNRTKGINIVPQIQDLSKITSMPVFDNISIKQYKYKSNLFQEFDNDDTVIPITGSRGCVRKCSFCNVESLWPKFVYRPAKQIVDQIEMFNQKAKISNFKFTDSLINGSGKHWRELNAEIIKRNLKINYSGQFIAKPLGQITQEDYDIAKKAGCSKLTIGVESGSESVRMHMKKKFNNASLYDMIENLSRRQIKQGWLFITGYPTETDQDFEETLILLKKYKHYGSLIDVNFVSFVLLPDCPLAWDQQYKDLKFSSTNKQEGSIVNHWVCNKNPTLDFNKRLQRFKIAQKMAQDLGYRSANRDKYKKRITDNNMTQLHETQILS